MTTFEIFGTFVYVRVLRNLHKKKYKNCDLTKNIENAVSIDLYSTLTYYINITDFILAVLGFNIFFLHKILCKHFQYFLGVLVSNDFMRLYLQK